MNIYKSSSGFNFRQLIVLLLVCWSRAARVKGC